MMRALTHTPSPHLEQCQLTFVEQAPIDFPRAVAQHEDYCRMLARHGVEVRTLDVNANSPDGVFLEDAAIVLEDVAVLCTMGTEARRPELVGIEAELRRYREVERIALPALIEGGDVLRVGRTLLVGLSSRTDRAGVEALADIVRRFGYRVLGVPVHGCLHLKTACTSFDGTALLVNPAWLDVRSLGEFEIVAVPDSEPWAANLVHLPEAVCLAAAHEETAALLAKRGCVVDRVDISEFAKAEGGVTCLSLLFE